MKSGCACYSKKSAASWQRQLNAYVAVLLSMPAMCCSLCVDAPQRWLLLFISTAVCLFFVFFVTFRGSESALQSLEEVCSRGFSHSQWQAGGFFIMLNQFFCLVSMQLRETELAEAEQLAKLSARRTHAAANIVLQELDSVLALTATAELAAAAAAAEV